MIGSYYKTDFLQGFVGAECHQLLSIDIKITCTKQSTGKTLYAYLNTKD